MYAFLEEGDGGSVWRKAIHWLSFKRLHERMIFFLREDEDEDEEGRMRMSECQKRRGRGSSGSVDSPSKEGIPL